MLDRNKLRYEPEIVKQGLVNKKVNPEIVDKLLANDQLWKTSIAEVEALKADRNNWSLQIGQLKMQGLDAVEQITIVSDLKEKIQSLDIQVRELDEALEADLLTLPNLPHASVPIGQSEKDNIEVRTWGRKQEFSFVPKPHWELAEEHGLIDFTRGVKVAGSGFIVYIGLGARLERSLINLMLDTHTEKHGYSEVFPPFLVNRASYIGTGQFPKFIDDVYAIADEDLFLISTAEVPITNLYRDEILSAEELPIKHAAYSACFRKEAGAAGKDTRGLLRVHEFNKVELVKFVQPENSYNELETLCKDAEVILQILEIPYRIVELCTGDLSFSAAKCYDIEIWSPGVEQWLEISSCSNFEDFQARRSNMRFRREAGSKPEFVHTLNGSGVALPRLVASLLENNQLEDGTIIVPKALLQYMGVEKIG